MPELALVTPEPDPESKWTVLHDDGTYLLLEHAVTRERVRYIRGGRDRLGNEILKPFYDPNGGALWQRYAIRLESKLYGREV